MQTFLTPVAADGDVALTIYEVVHRVKGREVGLYCNGNLLRRGDLRRMSGYLCLEQPLGSDGAVTVFLTAGAGSYMELMMKSGLLGHRLYLASVLQDLGCSGIGAFYDLELQDFLETEDIVCYGLAFGR
jgi:hypothetical protein